jgi:hypothetical protein
MLTRRSILLVLSFALVLALTAGCASTPESRIEENQTLFDGYPPDVQEKIRAGKVDIGFDEDMVRMALGDPDETSTDLDADGETLRWAYTRSRPGVSVGVGGGNYGGGFGMGGGVGVGSGPRKDYLAVIEFRDGVVSKVRFFDE